MKKKNRLRIAMLGHKRMPSREGGVEVVVEELSTRMAALGHEVTVYNRSGHHISGKEFDRKNGSQYKDVIIKAVPTIQKKGLAAVTSSFFAACACAVGRYDIVHIHAEGPAAMCWIPKIFRKRVIVTIHGLDHQRAGKWKGFAQKFILFGEKCAVKYADEIIVLSQSVQQYFKDTYGRKTIFIPNGIDRAETCDAALIKQKYGLSRDSFFLFLGRLTYEKGIEYLIGAFKSIKTGKKLVIAGGSSDTASYIEELKSLAAGDERILFTGFVQGGVLEELYSNAYVYVLPSDLEGMPISLLEAMSYGNCCVVSNIAECTEVVEDKAIIFKKSDVADLGKKLQMLCDDNHLVQKYKSNAADFICEKYDWNAVVRKTIRSYKK